MKKYFLFAVAAVGMMVACSKKDMQPSQEPDNSGAQAIRFNVDAPSLTVAKTKAAVDAWDDNEVYILGYKRSTEDFNLENALIANTKAIVPASGELTLQYPADSPYAGEPYFYAESEVYDFYGYYVDDAALGVVTSDATGFIVPLTITGTQDVMAAKADPEYDTDGTNVAARNAYSAYAARRDVHPTLQFEHLLTRFRFHLVVGSDAGKDVVVTGVNITSKNQAKLCVAPEVSLDVVQASDAVLEVEGITETTPVIPHSDGWDALPDKVEGYPAKDIIALDNPSGEIMVMPEALSHDLTVEFKVKNPDGTPGTESEFYKQPFEPIKATLNAADVVTEKGNKITKFEAGHQYDIVLKIYGPEKVEITAVLTAWQDGGHIDYDPDDYMEIPTAELKASTKNSLTFAVAVPSYVQEIEAGLSTTGKAADVTTWKQVSYTKALAANGAVQFDGLDEEVVYYFHMRYKKSAGSEFMNLDGVNEVIKAPASDFAILDSECVYEPTALNISWLDNGADVTYVVKNGEVEKAAGTVTTPGVFVYDTNVIPGEWSVTLTRGGVEKTITFFVQDVNLKVVKSYVVADESSYNLLPDYYLATRPWAEHKESIETNDPLPWMAIEVDGAPTSVEIVATCGTFSKTIKWTKVNEETGALEPFRLITISAKELGLTEMTAGKWEILVNGVQVNFDLTVSE